MIKETNSKCNKTLGMKKNQRNCIWFIFFCFQGVCAAGIIIFMFISVLLIPLGDASTVIFTAPIFCMILSAVFLEDRLGLFKIFAGMLLLVGVILVVRPPFLFPNYSPMMPIDNSFVTIYAPLVTKLIGIVSNGTSDDVVPQTPVIPNPGMVTYNFTDFLVIIYYLFMITV